MEPEVKESQEFTERKELLRLQKEVDETKFKQKMELIMLERENMRLFHERELERGRIKRAEERKLMQEKDYLYHSRK